KAELGSQARGAFQALAALKVAPGSAVGDRSSPSPTGRGQGEGPPPAKSPHPDPLPQGEGQAAKSANGAERHTRWDFGELPELLAIRRGGQTLIGFPALVDDGDAVRLEVFDEPDLAQARHREGLRRLVALQIKDALKYLEKNIAGLQAMGAAFMGVDKERGGGMLEELPTQIIELA